MSGRQDAMIKELDDIMMEFYSALGVGDFADINDAVVSLSEWKAEYLD